jgi:K+-transporting ATPase ATPase C chain
MRSTVRAAVVLLTMLTLITGVVYPALVTGLSTLLFPDAARGSLVTVDGKVVGSSLVGQPFSDARFFWGRPSATGPTPYNAASSSGSNLGPLNPALAEAVSARVAALQAAGMSAPVPVDLVTTSGSGLDPDVSAAAALAQVERVARARGLEPARVRALVERSIVRTPLHPARVNVLALNLALEKESAP